MLRLVILKYSLLGEDSMKESTKHLDEEGETVHVCIDYYIFYK